MGDIDHCPGRVCPHLTLFSPVITLLMITHVTLYRQRRKQTNLHKDIQTSLHRPPDTTTTHLALNTPLVPQQQQQHTASSHLTRLTHQHLSSKQTAQASSSQPHIHDLHTTMGAGEDFNPAFSFDVGTLEGPAQAPWEFGGAFCACCVVRMV